MPKDTKGQIGQNMSQIQPLGPQKNPKEALRADFAYIQLMDISIFCYLYRGYAKRHTFEGLDAWTEYRYRIRFMNEIGNSEWSQQIIVSTTSKFK